MYIASDDGLNEKVLVVKNVWQVTKYVI
jgi:hypothetical protein